MENQDEIKKEFTKLVDIIVNHADIKTEEAAETLQKIVHEGVMKNVFNKYFPEWWSKDRYTTFLSQGKRHLTIRCSAFSDFKQIYKHFKPTTDRTYIKSASSKTKVLNTPFRVDIDNHPEPQIFLRSENENSVRSVLKIKYKSEIKMPQDVFDIHITVCFNADKLLKNHEIFKEIISEGERKIYDSEHHYFTGLSLNKIKQKRIACLDFNDPNTIKWYGGNQTLINTWHIDNILAFLMEG